MAEHEARSPHVKSQDDDEETIKSLSSLKPSSPHETEPVPTSDTNTPGHDSRTTTTTATVNGDAESRRSSMTGEKVSIDINDEPVPTSTDSRRRSKTLYENTQANAQSTDNIRTPESKSRSASIDHNDTTPKALPVKTSRFGGFSASLPSVPWGTAAAARKPSTSQRDPSPQPPPPVPSAAGRRNTPFGWLSRATSGPAVAKSPPLPARPHTEARRNTAASISTLGSNSELMLKALEDTEDGRNGEKGPARLSLREKFKMLRMQEEAGVTLEDMENGGSGALAGLIGRSTNIGIGIASPAGMTESAEGPFTSAPHSPTHSININSGLPPGTVSGVSAAPTDSAALIDWDFWQSVVNEGPQAVARSSPEELNTAIAGGIPQTIRGVIWQVLASSKNEDLEIIYHDLCVRGTKDEPKDITSGSIASTSAQESVKEKESGPSSRASLKSGTSTPATSSNLGTISPSASNDNGDPISSGKLQTRLAGEQAKKKKTDAAALLKLEKMIRRDMGSRTSYSKYAAAAGFQDGLFNVCRAYALFDDAVGYPQGMNFIIMPMLFNMSESEAFCLLVRMMHKYQLRELFVQDMPGLHRHLYQFERLLEDLEPALYCHLNRRGVTPKLYATQWFLTLFAYRLPLQLVMRVFDLVLCEGLEGAILKFGMALIQRNVQALLAMDDMQALTTYMKEKLFDAYIDSTPSSKSILESGFFGSSGGTDNDIYRADILVQDACSVKLTPQMLGRYTAEWDEKTKVEKARETEVENLKTDTATKAAQIRSLEQRAEKSDAEHIEIANELVKLKVENQDLHDQNESLSGQVEELRKVAASEAANVEQRLMASTDKVMQKNIEVQNENRHMEEQMAEMERELVEMKLKYAELNGDYEGLKQRWSDLKRALE